MLCCPKCQSTNLRCHQSTPRNAEGGKTRTRYCIDCKVKFNTIEVVFVIPPKPKKELAEKEKPKTVSRNGKRILRPRKPMPSIEIEPDFDDLTDEELEAHIFSN